MKGKEKMTEQEKIALLEETLDAEEGSLKADMELTEVEEYDSMAKLSIIVMMEDEFGKKLSADDVRAFKTVGDILKWME
ncbi:acyl carrier protein [Butyrivibrio proteoclasticus]|uniref:acyl carrier protein n=1 Tax=Butyrivibrio proteoclasticus TaxID=43305 RepID=UPI000A992212|nr:acyl carrier protein [Butyrivibrio proteoclasticus]